MATAKKLPSGKYRVRIYLNDSGRHTTKSFTAKTKKEAEYMAAEYKANVNRLNNDNLTVGEAIDRYIESKESVLSPTTVKDYKKMRRIYLQGLMFVKLDDLTQEKVQLELNRESKTHSPKTIANMKGLLTSSVKMFRPVDWKLSIPQKEKKDIYIPTDDVIRKIYKTVKDTNVEIPFLLASQLGLRMSEILGLKEEDIGNGFITIRRARVMGEDGMVVKQPKSYSGNRTIPCSLYIIERINMHKDDGYIVNQTMSNLEKRWRYMLKKAEVPHFKFHALRHYFASQALLQGIPQRYISEMMGHASEDMINKVYQHTFAREKLSFGKAMAEKTNKLFEVLP